MARLRRTGEICRYGVSTVQTFEDNSRVKEAVAEPGAGRVLVVDGGDSLRCSLLGDLLAVKAVENGWEGIVIAGAIRDSVVIATLGLGVKALGTMPRKTERRDQGLRDVVIELGGVSIAPGDWLAADADGIVIADHPLV